jgi:hypothetical protein
MNAFEVYDDGNGPALYAGGLFETAGGVPVDRIAKWDGSDWSPLVGGFLHGVSGVVHSFAVHDFGGGEELIAGGKTRFAVDSRDSYLAKWGCPDSTPPSSPGVRRW